ncbi:BppU family phage baseplate upper protein [Bacillus cereus group sp. Bce040]|uniref:BppU family phage baseplate upper protein n=1 Tax=Bacillus cereus group sp. Bce040 TaxID=3445229 RepID=UPI003F2179BC
MKIKLVLDINKTQQAQLNAVVTGRQGDKETVTVNVFIVDSGVPYNLTGQDIYYEGLKPNNAYVRDKTGVKMINATQGNFEYTFRPETFGVAGVGRRSYFSIEQGGMIRASTQDFGLVTLADAMTGHTMSGPYISELEQLIQEAQWLVNDINSRWTSINTQLTQLQNKLNTMDVVKRSGDTMIGNLLIEGASGLEKRLAFSSGGQTLFGFNTDSNNVINMRDWKNNLPIFNYDATTKVFNVSSDTNLVKKTGDTLTGHLSMDVSSGEKVFRAQTGVSTYGAGVSFKKSGINLFDWGSNSNILQWDSANKTLEVANGVVNTNIVTKIKDGRANLTLTADALVIDANSPPLVNRRGNTVTFRCYMQRKVGSAGNLMTTLPVDMRPVDTVFVNALGHDGTVCRVTIGTDGNVFIGSGGKETEGKQIAETITYVVN